MTKKKLNIAIIGSGRVAKARVRELKLRDDVSITAIASADLSRAKSLAADLTQVYLTDNWSSLMERNDIDAIMICTFNELHYPICQSALKAGKHVSVDYPLALSGPDTATLIQLSIEMKVVLHVEHIELLSPWFLTLTESLPKIADLLLMRWTNISDRMRTAGDWTFEKRSGFSLFIHAAMLSRLIHIAGPPQWIDAQETLLGLDETGFDSRLTTATIGFSHNITAQICDGIGFQTGKINNLCTIIGSKGILNAEANQQVTLTQNNQSTLLPITPSSTGLFSQDISAFIDEINNHSKPYAPLSHVLNVAMLAEAGKQSITTGTRIYLR